MSDQPPVLLSEPDVRRHRANGPEIALWIIGVVLLVGSGVLTYFFIELIRDQTNQTNGPDNLSFFVAFTQSATIFTGGLVTAGILCIALALLMRGLDINARRRALPLQSHEVVAEPIPAGPAVASPVAPPVAPIRIPPARVDNVTTDYAAYMRPSDDSTDSPK
jgi:hypothetical protein